MIHANSLRNSGESDNGKGYPKIKLYTIQVLVIAFTPGWWGIYYVA